MSHSQCNLGIAGIELMMVGLGKVGDGWKRNGWRIVWGKVSKVSITIILEWLEWLKGELELGEIG